MSRIQGKRGRWVVCYESIAGGIRADRFSSLSRARRFARRRNGTVRRFRTRDYVVVDRLTELQHARMVHLAQSAKISNVVFRLAQHFVDHGTLLGAF